MHLNDQEFHNADPRRSPHPAARVLKKQHSPAFSEGETVSVSCGLCQYTFERYAKPECTILVCPSCGVRFEHTLPTMEAISPKDPEETLFTRGNLRSLSLDADYEENSRSPQFVSQYGFEYEQIHEIDFEDVSPGNYEEFQPYPPQCPSCEEPFPLDVVERSRAVLREKIYDESWFSLGDFETLSSENGIASSFSASFQEIPGEEKAEPSGERAFPPVPSSAPKARSRKRIHTEEKKEFSIPQNRSFRKTRFFQGARTFVQSVIMGAAIVGLIGIVSQFFPLEKPRNLIAFREQRSLPTEARNWNPSQIPVADISTVLEKETEKNFEVDFDVSGFEHKSFRSSDVVVPLPPVEKMPDFAPVAFSIHPSHHETGAIVPPGEDSSALHSRLLETERRMLELEQQHLQSLRTREQFENQSKKLVSETFLRESVLMLGKNSVRSLLWSLKSIRMLREIGQQIPDMGKLVLAHSLSAQTHGQPLADHIASVESLSINHDGKWLITATSDRKLTLWDISKSGEQGVADIGYSIDTTPAPIKKLVFTPELRLIAARVDGLVQIWDMNDDYPSETSVVLRDRVAGLSHIAVSPDSRWLVAYGAPPSQNGNPSLAHHGIVQPDPFEHSDAAVRETHPVPNSPDGDCVWLWDLNPLYEGKKIPRAIVLRGHERPIRCLSISPDSKWLATGSDDRNIRVYDLQAPSPGANQKVLRGHLLEITALQFGPEGDWIASGSRDNTIRVWDLRGESVNPSSHTLKAHNGWITSLAVSADGNWFASAGYDRTVRIWNTQSIRNHATEKDSLLLRPEQGTVLQVAFSPDCSTFITYGSDRRIKIWDMNSETPFEQPIVLKSNIHSFLFGESGRWLVLSLMYPDGSGIKIWPLKFEDIAVYAERYAGAVLSPEQKVQEESIARQFELQLIR